MQMEGISKKEDDLPRLLDFIPSERDWILNKKERSRVAEDRRLELKLGPPGNYAVKDEMNSFRQNDEFLSLGCYSRASKSGNLSSGAKRGFQLSAASNGEEDVKNAEPLNVEKKPCPSVSISLGKAATHARNPVVGWPPVRSFRKNLASSSLKPPPASPDCISQPEKKQEICKKGLFIKINMDGVAIGRKVDLKAYNSYDKLCSAVDKLFRGLLEVQGNDVETPEIKGLLDGTGDYTLVYEDNEGDRMLVGDVPWNMFVSTAKRLRVLKRSDLSTCLAEKTTPTVTVE